MIWVIGRRLKRPAKNRIPAASFFTLCRDASGIRRTLYDSRSTCISRFSKSVTLGIAHVTLVTQELRFEVKPPTHTPTTVHIVDFSKSLVPVG